MKIAIAWLRSIIFNFIFFAKTAVFCVLLGSLAFCLTRKFCLQVIKIWAKLVMMLCKYILGITYKIHGEFEPGAAIYASRHESYWETIFFHAVLPDPIFFIKQDLFRIPFFNILLKKLQLIPVSRQSSTRGDSKEINKANRGGGLSFFFKAQQVRSELPQAQFVIFPEGTRVMPNQLAPIKKGIQLLQRKLNLPIVVVYLDSGKYWPKQAFIKYPGCINVYLKPLDKAQDEDICLTIHNYFATQMSA